MYAPRQADANTLVRVGVGVIVQNAAGQILLEKRSDCGLWGLPGGRIEPGESVAQTVVREVQEETGLIVEITRLLGVYSEAAERIVTFSDNVVHLVDIVLEAYPISGELRCSHESEQLRFFDPTALPAEIVPPARAPLRDFVWGGVGVIR
jgi:mutator protein MutT